MDTKIPWTKDRARWLALASIHGIHDKILHTLWKKFGKRGSLAFDYYYRQLRLFEKPIATNPFFLAEKLDSLNIHFILWEDESYPHVLKHITDPPLTLFVRGNQNLNPAFPIAVVGTRHASVYGIRVAKKITTDLAYAGATIISGLAIGIDAIAQQSALQAGGKCIAVLGTGIDDASIYPRIHISLAKQILSSGGSIISEYPPGTQGLKYHFPKRNRIIAGLSQATLVIEASEKSGSLITAELANDYSREVFAVPGPITDARSIGTNKLISRGAGICNSALDILKHCVEDSYISLTPTLTSEEKEILLHAQEPIHIDTLARILKKPGNEISARICRMEFEGKIQAYPGDFYIAN